MLISIFMIGLSLKSQPTDEVILNIDTALNICYHTGEMGFYYDLKAIDIYNKITKILARTDTVVVTKKDNGIRYYYNEMFLTTISNSAVNALQPLQIHIYRGPEGIFAGIHIEKHITPTMKEVIDCRWPYKAGKDDIIRISHLCGDVLCDKYLETTVSGQTIVDGQYCQSDTNYIEIIETTNPETYDKIYKKILRVKYAYMSGTWKYYNLQGELYKEEEYGACH